MERVIEHEGSDSLWSMDKIQPQCCQCIDSTYTTNITSLINEQLIDTDFNGSSVSIQLHQGHSADHNTATNINCCELSLNFK